MERLGNGPGVTVTNGLRMLRAAQPPAPGVGPLGRSVARLFTNVLESLLESAARRRWMRRRAPPDLSAQLAQVLAAAAEQLLSARLTLGERHAIFQAALERFRRSSPAEQRVICAHLDHLDRLVPLVGRFGRRFMSLSPNARRRCLQACERSRWAALAEGHAQLRHLVQMAFMECAAVWPEAAKTSEGPSARPNRPAGRTT
jgi:hypothetical protein